MNFDSGDIEDIYQLSEEEEQVMEGLRMAFVNSIRLRQHIEFLYQKGSMYRIFNGNLLYHGCVPLDESGNLEGVAFGKKRYHGREYLDYAERIARRAWSKDARQKDRDFMWYLWCGRKSPLSGRNIKTFERSYVLDENTWVEQSNPYYKFYHEEKVCNMILMNLDCIPRALILSMDIRQSEHQRENIRYGPMGNCLSLMEASVRVIIRRLE